jgi:hypothetical protein
MTKDILPPSDDYKIRCPRLGHPIYFSYCRSENTGVPCFKIFDCWFEHFPVKEYLHETLTPDDWGRAFQPSGKTKVMSILELIEQAKNRK